MKRSNFFIPTLRENPIDAKIASHRLMLRSGMIRQSSAGIYSWLPLGFLVLKNIENIVNIIFISFKIKIIELVRNRNRKIEKSEIEIENRNFGLRNTRN